MTDAIDTHLARPTHDAYLGRRTRWGTDGELRRSTRQCQGECPDGAGRPADAIATAAPKVREEREPLVIVTDSVVAPPRTQGRRVQGRPGAVRPHQETETDGARGRPHERLRSERCETSPMPDAGPPILRRDYCRLIAAIHEEALVPAAPVPSMSTLFALLAALSNALNVITQHIASTSDSEGAKGWRLVRYLLRNPLWLFGWVALIAAFVFQALALHNGLLSAVQTLLMTELVFALVLRRVWLGQNIRSAAWLSAALTCVSISVFIVVAEPRGGSSAPSSHAWTSSILLCGGAAAILVVFALRGSPTRRAALFATAAGIVWGLEATFIKTTTDVLTHYGIRRHCSCGGRSMQSP